MSKRMILILAILVALMGVLSPSLMAQSKGDADRLFQQARELQEKARSTEDLAKAVRKYEEALSIYRKTSDENGESRTLCSLGNVYSDWGQYDMAVKYYQKALEIKRKVGGRETRDEAMVLTGLGNQFEARGQYEKAVEYYERALRIARYLGDRSFQVCILNNLGTTYLRSGKHAQAVKCYERALETENWIGSDGLTRPLGYLYGKEYYEKMRQAAQAGSLDSLFTAYTGLGAACEAMGEEEKAEKYYLKAVNLTEDLRSSFSTAQRQTSFGARVNGFLRTAPYDGLARVLIRMKKPLEALQISEYTKARVFAESMARWTDTASANVPRVVLKQDKDLWDRLASLTKKRQEAYEKSNKEAVSGIEPQVQATERKLLAHITMLREKYPLYAATKYPQPMDLPRTALNENEWILAYHVTDPGIIIYLIRGKDIVKAVFKPVPRDNLDSLVLTFRKPLELAPQRGSFEDQLKSFDLVAGKKLSDLLISDILESLPLQVPLIIAPHGSLAMLPFETLALNDKASIKTDKDLPYIAGAEFFGDRNPISYCESITTLSLARIRAKTKNLASRLLVIADPVYQENDARSKKPSKQRAPTGTAPSDFMKLMGAQDNSLTLRPKFYRLSSTGELAKSLSAIYGKSCDLYTGLDASKANFLKNVAPNIRQYDKIVIATHAYLGKDLPGITEPALVLTLVPPGTDGYLRATEVMSLNMNADIVALVGSSTGLGKQIRGEGHMSMGRAFRYAGARSVLTSLWSVSEAASTRLVERFFRNLKEGKSKSEALASARGEIRSKGFDHPFFWGGFVLVGEVD